MSPRALGRLVREQSLVVETDRGVTVVVGCCHPGVVRVMRAASGFGEIYGMVGGSTVSGGSRS